MCLSIMVQEWKSGPAKITLLHVLGNIAVYTDTNARVKSEFPLRYNYMHKRPGSTGIFLWKYFASV